MKQCQRCELAKQLTELKVAFFRVFIGDTQEGMNEPVMVSHEENKLAAVDPPESPAAGPELDAPEAENGTVREMILSHAVERLEVGEGLKMQSTDFYNDFSRFVHERYPNLPIPSACRWGRQVRLLVCQGELKGMRKSKVKGIATYNNYQIRAVSSV